MPKKPTPFELFSTRVRQMIDAHTARHEYRMVLSQPEDLPDSDWIQFREILDDDELISATPFEDGAIEIDWRRAIEAEGGEV